MIRSSAVTAFVFTFSLACDSAIADSRDNAVQPLKFARARSIETGELVRALDTRIDRVLTGGRWCDGNRSGYFRIVVCEGGFDEVYHWTFVQLMEIDEENHDVKAGQTINIPELSGLDKFVIDLSIDSPDRLTCADLPVSGTVRTRGLEGER